MLAAEQANAAKTALMSTMGHELRTPLNAIIGFSDLMRQAALGAIGSPQYEEFIVHINDSGKQLLTAINDILEIVSCDSGGANLNQNEINVVTLVDDVVKEIAADADAGGIQIINHVTGTDVLVSAEEPRLKKALLNLASNAVKFTERGGVVRLEMVPSDDGGLTLSIADNGIGISAEDLPRIMEPFEQADNSLSRSYEGLGLGASVARALVFLHGGDIAYESEPGKGTTVSITLPPERVVSAGTGSEDAQTA